MMMMMMMIMQLNEHSFGWLGTVSVRVSVRPQFTE